MAGDWMKMELSLADKPEVHYIANALNIDPDSVIGKLFRVWAWFNTHTTDGNALGVTFSLVDRLAGVTGFGEAMQFAGWLEQRDKVLHMPRFDRHTSESAKKRALSQKRQQRFRNADVTQKSLPEKRREEKKEKQIQEAAALPSWVPEDAWKAWLEVRPKVKAPNTPKALGLALRELERLRDDGNDPRAVLEQAALKGWRGLFPAKAQATTRPMADC